MARRKRGGASVGDVAVIAALAAGVLIVAFVAMVISVIVHSPVLLLLLLVGGGGLIAWKVKARTDHRRAVEAYQTRLEMDLQTITSDQVDCRDEATPIRLVNLPSQS